MKKVKTVVELLKLVMDECVKCIVYRVVLGEATCFLWLMKKYEDLTKQR